MLRGVSALRAVLAASCGGPLRHFSAVAGIPGAEPAKAPAKPPLSLAELLPPRPQLKLRKRPRILPALGPQAPLVAIHVARRSSERAPPGHFVPRREKSAAEPAAAGAAADTAGSGIVDGESAPPASDPIFAVIALGGTQYKVSAGDILNAEFIPGAAVGSELVIKDVLVAGSATRTVLGRPSVPGAVVRCAVEEQTLDRKLIVYKKKRRKRYQRFQGHRRLITRLRVTAVDADLSAF